MASGTLPPVLKSPPQCSTPWGEGSLWVNCVLESLGLLLISVCFAFLVPKLYLPLKTVKHQKNDKVQKGNTGILQCQGKGKIREIRTERGTQFLAEYVATYWNITFFQLLLPLDMVEWLNFSRWNLSGSFMQSCREGSLLEREKHIPSFASFWWLAHETSPLPPIKMGCSQIEGA